MKARIPPKNRLSKETLKQCAEYANSLQDANNRRVFKLACYVLHVYFGFGTRRLLRFISFIDTFIRKNEDNEVFWEQLDRDMKRLNLNFGDEEYEDIIGNWKKKNGLKDS